MLKGFYKITPKLKSVVRDMDIQRENIWKTAFMDVYDTRLSSAINILAQETQKAIISTNEYNTPPLRGPLMEAASDPNSIEFEPSPDFTSIIAIVRLDKTAGTIEDYATAVEAARNLLGVGKGKGNPSVFWARMYAASRGLSSGRALTSARGISGERARLRRLYNDTIEARLSQLMENAKAPYWFLIDVGNAGTMGGSGFPFPAIAPTGFTRIAEEKIESLFNETYSGKLAQLTERFLTEAADLNDLSSDIDDAIAGRNPNRFKPGRVLAEIAIGNTRYKLYITKTKKFGFAQRPRFWELR